MLLRDGERALLVDAGTGVRRLVTDAGCWIRQPASDVVLMHFHLDHACGLVCLSVLDLPVVVWGPGRALC